LGGTVVKVQNVSPVLAEDSIFRIVAETPKSQVGILILDPGEKTGGLHASDHPDSDQVVYVVSGKGEATVRDESAPLAPGDVLIIDAGDPHELRCTGDEPLRTFNVYAPAAY
jgi:mannose-6-phosphate isomerase-like protein (cupin superfamily)